MSTRPVGTCDADGGRMTKEMTEGGGGLTAYLAKWKLWLFVLILPNSSRGIQSNARRPVQVGLIC